MSWKDRYRDRLPEEKTKAELDEYYERRKGEKSDMLALLLAAARTILPFVLGLVGLLFLLFWLMFGR